MVQKSEERTYSMVERGSKNGDGMRLKAETEGGRRGSHTTWGKWRRLILLFNSE